MSNSLGVSPAVMLNRLVHRAATPPDAQLAKIAQLRLQLQQAIEQERQTAARFSPTGDAEPIVVDSGAVVDRLI